MLRRADRCKVSVSWSARAPLVLQYHGVLYSGRQRGAPLSQTLRELREGAMQLADEAIAARRERDAKTATRQGAAAAAAAASPDQGEGDLGGSQAATQGTQLGTQPRSSLKRERCSGQAEQQPAGSLENVSRNSPLLSPSQQQQERRRRLSGELQLAAAAAAVLADPSSVGQGCGSEGEMEAGLAAMSLAAGPDPSISREAAPAAAGEEEAAAAAAADEQRHNVPALASQPSKPDADLSSLRARLQAALGVVGGGAGGEVLRS